MYALGEKVVNREIEEEIKDSYISYAMSVIVGRALPDVRDGLKPVHRRILYCMQELGLDPGKPYKKSARIVGECFVKDTLVLTSQGLKRIQDIRRGEVVFTSSGQKPVIELYEMPPRPLLNVRLHNGIHSTMTLNQPIRVLNPKLEFIWKLAKDLTPNDYVVVRATYPEIQKPAELRRVRPEDPARFDEEMAYLLGFWLSDGWIEKARGRVGWYSTCRAVIERIRKTLQTRFSLEPALEEKPYEVWIGEHLQRHQGYQVRISRDAFTQFFGLNFGIASSWTAVTKRIPQQLFYSPRNVIWALISGLMDGDGSIHVERNIIHYGSVSSTLIEQLTLLLQHQGVFAHRLLDASPGESMVNRKVVSSNYPFHYLEIRGSNALKLAQRLNLSNPDKQARLDRIATAALKKSSHEVIPFAGKRIFKELSRYHLGSGWYQDCSGQKFRQGIGYPTGSKIRYSADLLEKPLHRSQIVEWGISNKLQRIGSPVSETIERINRDDLYFIKIDSITQVPQEPTFDLQVQDDHEFIANGMVVHNCLGKYHPHGDMAVYDALVRMVQDFSLRYPLIDGQGNFGSIDGDAPAAHRYTEARLETIAMELLEDLDKNTVDFAPNFDGSLTEPKVLPARIPNLLINGSSGIAVGMATNIPPHNLSEVVDALSVLIDDPECELSVLMKYIKGPDFPTGAIICGRDGIKDAYATGRGSVRIRAKAQIEQLKGNRQALVITELPYQVNKATLLENIAKLAQEKTVEGISDLRDESDKDGMRIMIELKRDANDQVVLNLLYKHTQMETSFGIITLALVDGRPRVLGLKSMLQTFVEHRKEIITRRTKFELAKAQERAHILEGLKKAIANLDAIIKLIRQSKTPQEAKEGLIKKFDFSDRQAQAILEMQLQRLTALERDKLEAEYQELLKKIAYYQMLLKNEQKVLEVIKDELQEVKKKFGDERRTEILGEVQEFKIEDLIAEEDVVITISHGGYIKRLPVSAYRKQRRGGVGVTAMETKEEDFVEHLFVTSTHEALLFFTNHGRCYWLKVHEVPQASRYARGTAIVNLLSLQKDERLSTFVAVKEFIPEQFLLMATKQGTIKKTTLEAYSNPRKAGIIAITLEKGDELIEAKITDGEREVLLVTKQGKAIRFPESQAREVGRSARGVRGIRLGKSDEVIAMVVVRPQSTLMTVTALGFGKRTDMDAYRLQSRGGKGITNLKVTKRNGEVVGAKTVMDQDEVMLISQEGMMVRCPAKDVRATGRATQGVRVISIKGKDRVASVACVVPKEKEEGEEPPTAEVTAELHAAAPAATAAEPEPPTAQPRTKAAPKPKAASAKPAKPKPKAKTRKK